MLFVPVPDIFAHAQAERHTNFSSIEVLERIFLKV